MNPSSGASSPKEPINVSVHGFFNKKMTFKSDNLVSTSFKVYNSFEALFKNEYYMLDYKAEDGKIYHLDRHQVQQYLDNPKDLDNPTVKAPENLSLRIVQQMKKDHPIVQEIKDMQRIFLSGGHSFKTKSGHVIRLYDKKGAVYYDSRLKQTITPKLSLQGQWADERIYVNKADYKAWLVSMFDRLSDEIGTLSDYPKKTNAHSIVFEDNHNYSQLRQIIYEYTYSNISSTQHLTSLLSEVNSLFKVKADADQAKIREKERADSWKKARQAEEKEKARNTHIPETTSDKRKTAFITLGLNNDASLQDIIKAYKKLTRLHHPDTIKRNVNESEVDHANRVKINEEKFKIISNAYHLLTDPPDLNKG